MARFKLNTDPKFLPVHRQNGWRTMFELEYTQTSTFNAFRNADDWAEANRWCMEQFGYKHPGWTGIRFYMVFTFRDDVAATAFRVRWG